MMFWFKKRHMKSGKNIAPMDSSESLRKSVSQISNVKFILGDFYKMDFMNGIVILVKVDEMYNILKSLLAISYW